MFASIFKAFKKRRDFKRLKDREFEFLFQKSDDGTVVVFDTETTGLNPKEDEVLSIGAVKIKENKIITSQTFEVYLKNTKEIDPKSIEIHKIRPCDLKDAKESQEAIKEFLYFIGSSKLVGYYLEFDVEMINKYIRPLLGIELPNEMVEVSELYFDKTITLIPQGNIDLRFDTIMQSLDLPRMGAHNAVNDAIMTAMIYLKLTN
ncbi:3'-5' exonuclease [Sulfurimonas sp. C5]|uniref:3'-5' exonuclease n=1 Tax=Sulfurimonas sp. C5 TaxID=3036947 RepID=UPI002453E6EC|nr:3'-5' exonuclease [Sulfurimonas sp. C5]MDH4943516.1 3'-5' exonuclease [Sulfurimonas sp. C5]